MLNVPDTICNTSPLIALDNIGLLDVLERVYSHILVAEEVRDEFGGALPDWIEVARVQNRHLIRVLQLSIDLGESATLALAMERANARVILDDLKGRKLAQRLGGEGDQSEFDVPMRMPVRMPVRMPARAVAVSTGVGNEAV